MNATFDRLRAEPLPNGKSERDAQGRFAPGNKGGPGNPYARQSALLKRVFLEEGSPERIRRVARKLFDLAEEGNVQAAKIVINYCLGKPTPGVNPDRVDIDEIEYLKESAHHLDNPPRAWTPEPELCLEALRTAREEATEWNRKMAIGGLAMTAEQARRINQLPPKERNAKFLAAYEKFKRKKEKEAARDAKRKAREAARQAREAARKPHDPFCNAAEIRVAGPIPNGKT